MIHTIRTNNGGVMISYNTIDELCRKLSELSDELLDLAVYYRGKNNVQETKDLQIDKEFRKTKIYASMSKMWG